MSTEWFIAKYIPDLRRREPRNVGVVLLVDGKALHRFVGDHPDRPQGVEGRSVANVVTSTENYKAWVERWRELAGEARVEELVARRPTDNYYLERGGFMLSGDSSQPEVLLHQLFATLVTEPETEKTTKDDPWTPVREVFERAADSGLDVTRGAEIEVEHDRLFFDFDVRHQRARSLYKMLKLNGESSKTWRAVHEAIYTIDAARKVASPYALVLEQDPGDQVEAQKTVLKARLPAGAAIYLGSDMSDVATRIMPNLKLF